MSEENEAEKPLAEANARLLLIFKTTPEYRAERERKNRTARLRYHRRRRINFNENSQENPT